MSSGAVCCAELALEHHHGFLQSHLENHLYEKILACLSIACPISILGGKGEMVARV